MNSRDIIPSLNSHHISDTQGRCLRDLRISVIDRCNFRCVYCMPKTVFGRDYPFLQRAELLSFEEIVRVAEAAVALGIEKIRITGGEPLLRRDLERLIEQLARLPIELTLTTNGSLLKAKARTLSEAGLHRVTVSLDALDEAVFRRMNDADYPAAAVLDGIAAAAAAGLAPIKINCVVKRGVNDDQILPLARHFRHSGHVLRFIEYMDAGTANGWRMNDVLSSSEVLARITTEYLLEPIDPGYPGEVAARWRYVDGGGEIGVIASVTQAFCSTCTRLRLSTDGKLYTCLFANAGHDLRAHLRNGASRDELGTVIASIWSERNDRYSEIRTAATAASRNCKLTGLAGADLELDIPLAEWADDLGLEPETLYRALADLEIRKTEAALDRVTNGTYGDCCRCGGEITAARLVADPAAPFCASCAKG